MQMPNYCGEFQPKYGDGSPTFRLTGSVWLECSWLRPCKPTDAKEAGPCESECVHLASLESRCHSDCWDVEALCYHFQKVFRPVGPCFSPSDWCLESINGSSLSEMDLSWICIYSAHPPWQEEKVYCSWTEWSEPGISASFNAWCAAGCC